MAKRETFIFFVCMSAFLFQLMIDSCASIFLHNNFRGDNSTQRRKLEEEKRGTIASIQVTEKTVTALRPKWGTEERGCNAGRWSGECSIKHRKRRGTEIENVYTRQYAFCAKVKRRARRRNLTEVIHG